MKKHSALWFKVAVALGLVLGIVLLVESVATYHNVTSHLAIDHLNSEAGRYVSLLETRVQEQNPPGPEELQAILDELQRENSGQIAWIRVANQEGEILARSGKAADEGLDDETIQSILDKRQQSVAAVRETPAGDALVVALPFRFRFSSERMSTIAQTEPNARPRFKIAQLAIFLHGSEDIFRPLVQNLLVSAVAALALLGTMVFAALRFGSYMRGKSLEQQVATARQVQQNLLPHGCPACEHLDFAAEFVPFWEVGGDYYDVFSTEQGNITIVLGDVSGKGLPAALLMSLLHGAVRASAEANNGSRHSERTSWLNQLLCDRSEDNRFVSLFWASYDIGQAKLQYVNAGHLPPLLVRQSSTGIVVRRLEKGGPVLGILRAAIYEEETIPLATGDLLVMFSDGVLEATNSLGEEYGEERLLQAVESCVDFSADEVKNRVLGQLKEFVGREGFDDDLTLLVARFGGQKPAS
jgi:sigma-B regulation protein RsbU (phosphoserine phosphatase)